MTAWLYEPDIDPLDWAAFVYRISLPTGQFYVGKKSLWVAKAGKIVRESDWRTYWGSGKDVKAAVKAAGLVNCTREVLTWCVSRGEAGWRETEILIKGDLLLDPLCLNGNVAERYQRKVVQGWSNDDRRERYLRDLKKAREALAVEA